MVNIIFIIFLKQTDNIKLSIKSIIRKIRLLTNKIDKKYIKQ